MIRPTQFPTMGDPVGDPWIWAYPPLGVLWCRPAQYAHMTRQHMSMWCQFKGRFIVWFSMFVENDTLLSGTTSTDGDWGQGWGLVGTRTRSTRVPNFSTRTRTQTTGNMSTRTRTQHQSTQYSHEYRPSTSSEWVWFSLNSWDFEYYSLQIEWYHLIDCLIRWNSSLCWLINACYDRKDCSEKKETEEKM